jgi:cyclic pyranopterin phosphate synthase
MMAHAGARVVRSGASRYILTKPPGTIEDMADTLTHLNAAGEAHMVDIGDKDVTRRVAVAEGHISMRPETLAMITAGGHRKGDVLGVARLAGIMAAKKTAELVPLCHPVPLTHVEVAFAPDPSRSRVNVSVTTRTEARTGVEMEALAAVQVSLLTIYDMCKAVDRSMEMGGVRLIEKSGGRSGPWRRADAPPGDQ